MATGIAARANFTISQTSDSIGMSMSVTVTAIGGAAWGACGVCSGFIVVASLI